jgi:hypothetical protein
MWKASPILAGRVEHEQVALMNTSTEEEWKPCKRTEQSMDRQASMPMCWSPDRNFPRVRDATVQRFSGPFSDFTDGHTHALECASRRERPRTQAEAAAHPSSFPAADKIVLRKPNFQAN